MVLLTLGLAAYANSFPGVFVLDDVGAILENETLRAPRTLAAILSPPEGAGVGGRPLANLSFALNYAISGLGPWSYHALNLLIHLAVALLLYGVTRRTLLLPEVACRCPAPAHVLALTSAGLWLLHPLGTGVVNYVSQRTEGLMTVCYLLTFYAFIRATASRGTGNPRPLPGVQWRWGAVAVAACAFGMTSKEIMVTAPVMVLLYDRTFVAGSLRAAWQTRWRFHVALGATWLVLVFLILRSPLAERGVGFGLNVGPLDYALTECRAVLIYLRLSFWPHPLVFDYGWTGRTGGLPAVFAVSACAGLMIAALWALVCRRFIGFVAGWFILILAPTSSIIPIIQQPIAENRMYLPLAGLIAGAVIGGWRLLGRKALLAAIIVGSGFAVITFARNHVYATPVRLWSDTVMKVPGNARAQSSLAAVLLQAGDAVAAIAPARTATRLAPNFPDAHTNLAAALLQTGRVDEAIAHFSIARESTPASANVSYNLGEALLVAGRVSEAISTLETAVQLDPEHARAHNNLSVAFLQAGQIEKAVTHAERAVRLTPNFAAAHYNAGNALIRASRPAEAIPHFETALRLQPSFARAANNLGVARLAAGDVLGAVDAFANAVRLDPGHAEAWRNLDIARHRRRATTGVEK